MTRPSKLCTNVQCVIALDQGSCSSKTVRFHLAEIVA